MMNLFVCGAPLEREFTELKGVSNSDENSYPGITRNQTHSFPSPLTDRLPFNSRELERTWSERGLAPGLSTHLIDIGT